MTAGKVRTDHVVRTHPYTFGAYGRSPIVVDVKLPERRLGLKSIELAYGLRDVKAARSVSFSGRFRAAAVSIDALVEEHQQALREIAERLKPDTPKMDPALMGLGLLDQKLREAGRRTLFATTSSRLKPSRNAGYAAKVEAPVAGLHQLRTSVVGSTHRGTRYLRTAISSVRT